MYTLQLLIYMHLPPPMSQSSDNALVQSAGVDCLTSLCQLLGRMILRGRIEQHDPTWVCVMISIVVYCITVSIIIIYIIIYEH